MLLTRHQRALITAEKYHISVILENKFANIPELSLTVVESDILMNRIDRLDEQMRLDDRTYLPV